MLKSSPILLKRHFSQKSRTKCVCPNGFASNLSEDSYVLMGSIPPLDAMVKCPKKIKTLYCRFCFGILKGGFPKNLNDQIDFLQKMNKRLKEVTYFTIREGQYEQ